MVAPFGNDCPFEVLEEAFAPFLLFLVLEARMAESGSAKTVGSTRMICTYYDHRFEVNGS